MSVSLYSHQLNALHNMKNGCILNGGVGSGKSRTAIAYYFVNEEGQLKPYKRMKKNPMDLYIITTAQKRDKLEWEGDLLPFQLSLYPEFNIHENTVTVDSWNNVKNYKDVKNAFFIFDEQRVVGSGTWVKSFLQIAKNNKWILLTATPGDTWTDYIPVFIANGFYKNRTEFLNEHVVYSRFTKYPSIDRFLNTGRLIRLRNNLLIDMEFNRHTIPHHTDLYCEYDKIIYKTIMKDRWNIYGEQPIKNASELCYTLRKLVTTDVSRIDTYLDIVEKHPRVIVFYNFNYELDILKGIDYGPDVAVAEWNGHKHQPIPDAAKWVYLVQYTAGAEGWNCIITDTIIFFSQNYSYKILAQALGRIDRLNTPYTDLYYYHLKSMAPIDLSISKSLRDKKKFNEGKFVNT